LERFSSKWQIDLPLEKKFLLLVTYYQLGQDSQQEKKKFLFQF